MTELIRRYTDVLQAAGLTVKDDGSVFKGEERYFIKGKPLMLPLTDVLKRSDVGEKLIFHPFSEAAAKGESDTLEDLRGRFALQLNVATSKLIAFFLKLGSGETKIALDPEQIKVMKVVKNVGEKEVRDILSVLKATAKGEGKRTPLVKLYLSRRPNQVGNTKYLRTCVVTFPLYQAAKQELAEKTKGYELLGVSINEKALKSLCHLIEFIYPGIDKDAEAYNQGSTNQIAPFADALLRGVGGLYSIFNEKVNLYKEISEVGALQLPTSWIDVVDCMDELFTEINRIPLQPNADGKARVAEVQTADLAVRGPAAQPVVAAPAQQTATPQVNITAAPQMQHVAAPPPVAAAPAGPEPEYIKGPTGLLMRNPNYLRPAVVGGYGPGVSNKLDPYGSGVLMPANTSVMPMPSMMNQGMFSANLPQPGMGMGYGVPQAQSPAMGGLHRLPGLSF